MGKHYVALISVRIRLDIKTFVLNCGRDSLSTSRRLTLPQRLPKACTQT